MRFSFQNTSALVEFRQTNDERLAAMHTHWGGPAFWAPTSCPSLRFGAGQAAGSSPGSGGIGRGGGSAPTLAASARPDTARGPRPAARQMSRLSLASSSVTGESAAALPPASARSMSAGGGGLLGTARSLRPGGGSGPLGQAYVSGAEAGALLTARGRPEEQAEEVVPLTMDQLVAEVRRSCPIAWSATLRVRVNLKLVG